jgi:hypothetical protein
MSKLVVNLESAREEQETFVHPAENEQETIVRPAEKPSFVEAPTVLSEKLLPKRGGMKKALAIIGIALVFVLIAVTVGGFLYWQNLKSSPQYSLALLVDAARRNDQKTLDELIDTDAVVDDFMPQVTDKAVELYGRGLAPTTIQRLTLAAAPLIPSIKQFARNEVPAAIREKTKPFESYPFWAIAIGAGRYLEIVQDGDNAYVKSKNPQHNLELTMKRKGDVWQVVAVRDDALARRIAEKYGQKMISDAKDGTLEKTIKGKPNVEDLKKKLEDIFK